MAIVSTSSEKTINSNKPKNTLKLTTDKKVAEESTEAFKEASVDAQERLAEVMLDSPSVVTIGGRTFELTALHPGTQMMIAQEACKIKKSEHMSAGDVIMELAKNIPSCIKIVALLLLNDKERIKNELRETMDFIEWESTPQEWVNVMAEAVLRIDVGFFFQIINSVEIFREVSLMRKKTIAEQRSFQPVPNGEK